MLVLSSSPYRRCPQVVAEYLGKDREYREVAGMAVHWAGGREGPPADTPRCGFDGSGCPPDSEL